MIKLLQVFNQYRSQFNGEEAVVERIHDLVASRGGQSRLLMRTSREIEGSLVRKAQAAVSGVYNRASYREMIRLLREDRPDVVHVHNLYPLFSPSVLVACRRERVPVVMTLHNQQLTCPKADHLYQGSICQRCVGGKEYYCALKNCRGNILESIAYAARSAVASRTKVFEKNVNLFIALSEAAKSRLVAAGFDDAQIVVLPNMAPSVAEPTDAGEGQYFAFAGRMSPEKGIETILAAAALAPECPVRLAGDGPLFERLKSIAPPNVQFVGRLAADGMAEFYRRARALLHSSTCFEMCPLVISEAMMYGLPVIASNIGGREELVDVGRTGLLFPVGSAQQLASHMRTLWNDPARCRAMGRAGHELASRRFGEDLYFENLMAIYRQAIGLVDGPSHERQPAAEMIEHASI